MATLWEGILDPYERVEYVAEFGTGDTPVLQADETIASYIVSVTAAAAALGLMVSTAPNYAPRLSDDLKSIIVWLEFAPEQQENAVFDAGVELGVVFSIITNSSPARRRQRTWTVEAKQL